MAKLFFIFIFRNNTNKNDEKTLTYMGTMVLKTVKFRKWAEGKIE